MSISKPLSLCILALTLLVACGDEGSGPDPQSCSAANCSGCCQGNFCINAPTDSACGAFGQACVPCSVGMRCISGTCQFSRTGCEQSCSTGCCQDGLCQQGTSDYACGDRAQPCADCTQQLLVCDPYNRVCAPEINPDCNAENCAGCCNGNVCEDGNIETSCGAGGITCRACDGEEVCLSGECLVEEKKYDIVLGRVVYQVPMDCFELECDPYVIVTVASQDYESSHKAGNTVVFDETIVRGVDGVTLTSSGFSFVLWEDNSPLIDLSRCDGIVRPSQYDLTGGKEIVADCERNFLSIADVSFKFVPSN